MRIRPVWDITACAVENGKDKDKILGKVKEKERAKEEWYVYSTMMLK